MRNGGGLIYTTGQCRKSGGDGLDGRRRRFGTEKCLGKYDRASTQHASGGSGGDGLNGRRRRRFGAETACAAAHNTNSSRADMSTSCSSMKTCLFHEHDTSGDSARATYEFTWTSESVGEWTARYALVPLARAASTLSLRRLHTLLS